MIILPPGFSGIRVLVSLSIYTKLKASGPRSDLCSQDIDPQSASITQDQINEWVTAGIVENRTSDMKRPPFIDETIVCLPSYREGLPKALLEAASSARPVTPRCFGVSRNRQGQH